MIRSKCRSASMLLALASLLYAGYTTHARQEKEVDEVHQEEEAMLIQYLEIVTPDVDATCDALGETHGVSFGKADPGLGNARTAALKSGGRIGVRAPMADHEQPLVRPYILVDDIEAAVRVAEEAGGTIALPPSEIPGQGKFAIYILGGIQHGLWEFDGNGE